MKTLPRRPRPVVRVVGTIAIDGYAVPPVEVAGADRLDRMGLDRLVQDAGLREWVRPLRPDDAPDLARAIDPTPEHLDRAEARMADFARSTHMLVRVLAEGVRARRPIAVIPAAELN